MHADKMKTPLLLIHGEADNNSGTYPLQSKRYFNALKGTWSYCQTSNATQRESWLQRPKKVFCTCFGNKINGLRNT